MRTILVMLVTLLLLDVAVLCGDVNNYIVGELLRSEKVERNVVSLTAEKNPIQMIPQAQYVEVHSPHHVVGNALEWITFNAVAVSGWSWTGYSSVSVDDQLRPTRWKFGLVGGELEAMRPIHDPNLQHMYEHDDKAMQYTGLFGLHLYREF